jgi:hypothetical protein
MSPNRAVTRWPRKHQKAEKWFQLVGPKQAGNAKNQIKLHYDAEN